LLTSASEVLGKRLIAVVLTGSGRDGTDGVQSVHARGGVVIAQDPATVRYSHMPAAAIASGAVTQVLPVEKIGPALIALVREGSPNGEKALR
jgi:chemotaxis response regulator CheB